MGRKMVVCVCVHCMHLSDRCTWLIIPPYSSVVGILSLLCICFFVRLWISQRRKKIASWNFTCLFDYYLGWACPVLVNFGLRGTVWWDMHLTDALVLCIFMTYVEPQVLHYLCQRRYAFHPSFSQLSLSSLWDNKWIVKLQLDVCYLS